MFEKLMDKQEYNNLKTAEKYITRYLDDLQNHFDLTDNQLIKLVNSNISKIKKRNNKKKWWQIFEKSFNILFKN